MRDTRDGRRSDVCKSVNIAESTLALSSDEPPGEHCATGGQRIDTGFDDNGNGLLDTSEVIQSVYVCNGATGPAGSDGSSGAKSLSR